MSSAPEQLQETTIDGPKTRRWVLGVGECRELGVHRMVRLGIEEAVVPYERVRCSPGGSFLMACREGVGRVLLDGRWQTIGAETVCMAPPRIPNAFQAVAGKVWKFCWVRYEEPEPVMPLVGAASPVKVHGGGDLWRAMEGLRGEWEGDRDPKLIHHWMELVQGAARRLAQPFRSDERLRKLWQKVEMDLTRDWTLPMLAYEAHVSPEHLRRICRRELGRTPMQQVMSIRMMAARRLLERSDDKLEVVAAEVGYGNAFIFSRVFKRVVGVPPVQYRGQR